jgi:ADP-ribose pyrophosphatase YjhB (NUDIX family)
VRLAVERSVAFDREVLVRAGGTVEPGEPLQQSADRELQEELGWRASQLVFLGELHPFKYLTSRQFVFLARGLPQAGLLATSSPRSPRCSWRRPSSRTNATPNDLANGTLGRSLNPPSRSRSSASGRARDPSAVSLVAGVVPQVLPSFASVAGEVAPCLGEDEQEVRAVRNAPMA